MLAADKKRVQRDLGLACLIFGLSAVVTALAGRLGWDLHISSLFYEQGRGFVHGARQPWSFLYHWGTLPGLLITFACLAGLGGVALGRVRADYRKPLLVLVLTTFVASAVLVNGVLKTYWGRPRPCQVQQFGGEWEFQKVWPPGKPGRGRSFPSGHASMGFLPIALYAFVRVRPRFARACLGGGLAYGCLMGAARVVQGDHFPTDVLWAFATVAMTGLVLDAAIPEHRELPSGEGGGRWRRPAAAGLIGAAAVAALAMYLTAEPFYEHYRRYLWIRDSVREVVVQSNVSFVKKQVQYSGEGQARILVDARGFGAPWARWRLCAVPFNLPGKLVYVYHIETEGHLSELFYEARVILPRSLEGKVSVSFTEKEGFPFRRVGQP
ncbi:MAG: phosphatase PAP2 family protein [Thermodesulfobacteriota bacterium]